MTPGVERRATIVARDGEKIYAEATGAGEPIVLCHGLGGNHAIWWQQIGALARRYCVIAWDQRGFGNSTAHSGRTGIDEAAGDLIAVLDTLQIPRAHLVGQSMGAFVALRAAVDHPGRVLSLVLSTTLAGADPRHTRALHRAVPDRPRRDRHPVVSADFSQAHPNLVVLYNLISSFGTKPPVGEMLEAMAAHRFGDDELDSMAVPTLFLAAANDEFCPPAVMKTAAARIRGAQVSVLPGASHSVFYEQPAAWTDVVLRFVGINRDIISEEETG
jgi:pimeloyl-ACP methyl ester carboxylesterase